MTEKQGKVSLQSLQAYCIRAKSDCTIHNTLLATFLPLKALLLETRVVVVGIV